jgi:hypothetical protein
MPLTITLTTELEQKLRALAAQNGKDTADYVLSLLEKQISNGHRANGSALQDTAQNGTHSDAGTHKAAEEDRTTPTSEMAVWDTRTPEQKAQQINELLARSRPARPLPPGKTFAEVVAGQWPGDETDEEVQAALDELS